MYLLERNEMERLRISEMSEINSHDIQKQNLQSDTFDMPQKETKPLQNDALCSLVRRDGHVCLMR
jgi:hypothetical protein